MAAILQACAARALSQCSGHSGAAPHSMHGQQWRRRVGASQPLILEILQRGRHRAAAKNHGERDACHRETRTSQNRPARCMHGMGRRKQQFLYVFINRHSLEAGPCSARVVMKQL
jgi:hypothetical protein